MAEQVTHSANVVSPSVLRLCIRADASAEIGVGHVMRCLALAQAWQDAGGSVTLVTSALTTSLADRLRKENIEVSPLQAVAGSTADAAEFLQLAAKSAASAIVVDGYHFGQAYHDTISRFSGASLTIDDTGQLSHYATSYVLNQNLGASATLYENRDGNTRLLLGTDYALIRREFRQHDQRGRSRDGSIKRVLVTLGGSDPDNITETVVRGLLQLPQADLHIRVLAGFQASRCEQLVKVVGDDDRFEVLPNVEDMAAQYAWADFAIAAGGSSNWEMCLFGLPRGLVIIAENQRQPTLELARRGAALNLGDGDQLPADQLASTLYALFSDPERIVKLGNQTQVVCDGRGSARVCAVLGQPRQLGPAYRQPHDDDGERKSELALRPATLDDWEMLLQWRNDPITRSASINTAEIAPQEHRSWLTRCLADPNRTLLIAELAGRPVGTVRIDDGEQAEMSWTVAPSARGQGVGARMVRQALVAFPKSLVARTHVKNIASQKIAIKCGFRPKEQIDDWILFVLERPTVELPP